MTPDLSIVIPAYNEANRIHRALEGIISFFKPRDQSLEIVVVCDGCTDDTAAVTQNLLEEHRFDFQIIEYQPNRGKGEAVKKGMLESRGKYRIFTDADLSTPLESLNNFFPEFQQDTPIIIGSRKCPGARIKHHQPWYREFMGKVFTGLSNVILSVQVTDYTCGLKAFRSDTAEKIFSNLEIGGWAFDAEIIYLASKYDYSIQEIPVIWEDVEGTKVNPFKEAVVCAFDLLRIRWNDFMNNY
jgi:dolichyl-phosphate beta-glucosyltransferase